MKVLKFGGTSVADAENISKLKSIVDELRDKGEQLCIVCSAFSGVTSKLIALGESASTSDPSYRQNLDALIEQHKSTLTELVPSGLNEQAMQDVEDLFNELRNIIQGISLIREYTIRSQALLSSYGEQLSCRIISNYLDAVNIDCSYLDARRIIKTDDAFINARLKEEETNNNIQEYFRTHQNIQIVTGFIASTDKFETTTLGRGGSDYTAAIIAAALNAEEVQIWTDVDGIMTADPRIVKNAFALSEVSYIEALELSHFGAKVLYPPTVLPLVRRKIPIRIKNTFNPDAPGTLISESNGQDAMPVKAVSSLKDIALINIEGGGIVGVTGVAGRIFTCLSENNINIILITQASSEISICIGVDPSDAANAKAVISEEFALEIHKKKISMLEVQNDVSVVAIIGERMKQTTGISGKLFGSLGKNGVNVIAVAQGSSEYNVSVVIKQSDLKKALIALHEAFFLSDRRVINFFMAGTGLIGKTLIKQMQEQAEILEQQSKIKLRLIGVANSKKSVCVEDGIDFDKWEEELSSSKESSDELYNCMSKLNLSNTVFLDNTSNEQVVAKYRDLIESNISIVTPNKKACSGTLQHYQELRTLVARRGVKFLYETNVGAGLPIISTLKDLLASGDRIIKVEAVLSGTLSYIFNSFGSDSKFSEVVKQAQDRGFTEPDPRDDLNGMDVARKILIIARECGSALEIDDISMDSFLPQSCFDAADVDAFYAELKKFDSEMEELSNKSANANERLRYIAKYEDGKASVSLESVSSDHPFYDLSGADNIIAFTTERYLERPLVVKGPGAGAEVTAAGVFSDLIRIAHYLS